MSRAAYTWASLVAGAALVAGACSLGSLDGYDVGGTGGHGGGASSAGHTTGSTGSSTGHGAATSASASTSASTSNSATASTGVGASSTASTGTAATGTGGGAPCPTMCGSTCVDLTSDPSNCGACGVACGPGYKCSESVCGDAVEDVSTFLATCAVLHGGEVWCWGRDVWGEIGIPSSDPGNTTCYQGDKCRTSPTQITAGLPSPATDPAVAVQAGREATCVLTKAGAVYCFGSNEAGMLGHDPSTDTLCTKGTTTSPPTGRCSPTPQKVALPAGTVVTQISLGTVTACALTSTNDVYCWGSNASAEEKQTPSSTLVTTPALLEGGVAEVSVGADESGQYDAVCVIKIGTNDVICWGASSGSTIFPTPAVGACTAGGDSHCSTTNVTVPTVFSPNNGVAVTANQLAMGVLVGVALQGTTVVTWGNDNYGQSGLGAVMSPGAVHFDPRALSVPAMTAVANAGLTTLMLDTTGNVWAVGWSDSGQIGNGVYTNGTCPIKNGQQCADKPVQLTSPTGVAKIRSGTFNSAAITKDGKLWMWGTDYEASLGHMPGTDGDTNCGGQSCNASPVQVTVAP